MKEEVKEGRMGKKGGRKEGREGASRKGRRRKQASRPLFYSKFYFTPTQDLSIEGLALVLSPPFF